MPTDEIRAIADQLARAHDGAAWYGAPTMAVLRSVTAQQASERPIPQAHTIWELVLHITAWHREVVRRLRTGVAREPEFGDWPTPPAPSEAAWRSALQELRASHRELLAAIERFPAESLDDIVRADPDRAGTSYYVLLHGIVQHTLAHTAQISLLKKAFTAE